MTAAPRLHVVFDLDGCLYSYKATGIDEGVSSFICLYMQKQFGLTETEARDEAERLYKQHGNTALGIQRERNSSRDEMHEYFAFIHNDLDLSRIEARPDVAAKFEELSLTPSVCCWLLTNSTEKHAKRCLQKLGFAKHFFHEDDDDDDDDDGDDDDAVCCSPPLLSPQKKNCPRVFDCFDQWTLTSPGQTDAFVCKPSQSVFEKFQSDIIKPNAGDRIMIIDDSLQNLVVARRLGWETVLVTWHETFTDQQLAGHVVVDDALAAVEYVSSVVKKKTAAV